MNEFAPFEYMHQAEEAYEESLNELYGTVSICGITYDAGRAFKMIDPIAFHCGFNDWLDSVQEDMEEAAEATAWCLTCGQDNDEEHTDTAHDPNWVEYV